MSLKLKEKQNEEGFTLIELLVVVIIIGILAAIAIPVFLNQRESAWQGELTSTMRNVALEVEAAATATGGDYADAVDDEAAVTVFLNRLQGSDTDPVEIVDYSPTSTTFTLCGEHDRLDGSVTYDSDDSGVQDYSEADCDGVSG